ncbi:MAG: hypothetical protein GXP61_07420 [Epsilonproteobacteria bacterium]|nr:hypothetical protein [Campylobacterota bacterium]
MNYRKNLLMSILSAFVFLSLGSYAFGATNLNQPFHLNIVEIMDVNFGNSVGAQPKFYVIDNDGKLKSSSEIVLPANRKIVLTITSYDMDNAPVLPEYTHVSGTVDNKVFVINGAIASGDDVHKKWGANVSSIPKSKVIHTFAIPSLGINIPIEAGTTEIAVIKPIKKTGTFYWECATECGSGKDGMSGAMATSGWMNGKIVVR